MRLDKNERVALERAIDGVEGDVYLFGSRADDTARGGDIDILVFSDAERAFTLLRASLESVPPYDASATYSPKEREPYDALSDRFIRAVEVAIRFFRTYERLMYAENSDTYRDLLGRIEKLDLVSSVTEWVDMREVRNRIAHDYLPEHIKQLYDQILGPFGTELMRLSDRLPALREQIDQLDPGTSE